MNLSNYLPGGGNSKPDFFNRDCVLLHQGAQKSGYAPDRGGEERASQPQPEPRLLGDALPHIFATDTRPAPPPERTDPSQPLARSSCGPSPPPRAPPEPGAGLAARPIVPPWRAWGVTMAGHGPGRVTAAGAGPAAPATTAGPDPPLAGPLHPGEPRPRPFGAHTAQTRPNRSPRWQGHPAALSPHSGARVPPSPLRALAPLAQPRSALRRPAPLRSAGATSRSGGQPRRGPAGCRWPSPRRSPPRAGT